MPEGPEVETIRNGLLKMIDQKIIEVKVADHKKYNPISDQILHLKDHILTDIERRGKFLLFEFKNDICEDIAINHLGMSGIWYLYSNQVWNSFVNPFEKYPHYKVYFRLENMNHLLFVNIRTFGRFEVIAPENVEDYPSIKNLGPDILEKPFDTIGFVRRVKGTKRPRTKEIGKLLLDSDIVAGCGNIYKNEALFRAKINPFTPANELSRSEIESLGEALSNVAHLALKLKGSTIKNFQHVNGYNGLMQNNFQVYGKAGDSCNCCGNTIKSGKQGGRTSFWCSSCQQISESG